MQIDASIIIAARGIMNVNCRRDSRLIHVTYRNDATLQNWMQYVKNVATSMHANVLFRVKSLVLIINKYI